MTNLSEVFYVMLVTTVAGLILKLASLCFKSRCKTCKLCCLEIVRDTEAEEREREFELTHKQTSSLDEK
jgi:Flp pilus assembly protein protease CpaA